MLLEFVMGRKFPKDKSFNKENYVKAKLALSSWFLFPNSLSNIIRNVQILQIRERNEKGARQEKGGK